jgi:hypothetical protein
MYNFIDNIENVLDITSKYFQPVSIFFYILYFGILSGIFYFNIDYLNTFKLLIHGFICLFLLVRFHPFREHSVTKHDARIIFASAVILILNTGIIEYINTNILENKLLAFHSIE